jgi:endonuclease/exonuclease/phosphatase family metal-dependent hydrolase
MASPNLLRLMTYNVHRCVGLDGKHSPGRIARAIAEQKPDVVALQELDVNRARTAFANQASLIASELNMNYLFFPAIELKDEHFGNAILSPWPLSLVRAGVLPWLPHAPHRERRAALWAAFEWEGCVVQIINTHLGLVPGEQVLQSQALLSEEWLGHPHCTNPRILCGDLNAIPGSRAYRRLTRGLHDPVSWFSWPPGTFPSWSPLLRLDHVLFDAGWIVCKVRIPRTRLTRVASDHLPVVVEASLASTTAAMSPLPM